MIKDREPTMLAVSAGGEAALADVRSAASQCDERISLSSVHLLAPIERPGKFLAIGMNYRKHAEEAKKLGIKVPEQPLWINKQNSCITGPDDYINPGDTEKIEYEGELGVVIGKPEKGGS